MQWTPFDVKAMKRAQRIDATTAVAPPTVKKTGARPIAVILLTLSLLLSSGIAVARAAPVEKGTVITPITRKCPPLSYRATVIRFCPR